MRYIPTPDERVEHFKKQAKRLHAKVGGKHTELLDLIAKQADYDHWHHVVQCNGRGKAAHGLGLLRRECERIVAAALANQIKIQATGPEIGIGPFVLLSTTVGDAWLLDPSEQLGICLLVNGERIALKLDEDPLQLGIYFHGHYELIGDFFHIQSHHPLLGDRAIGGYPLGQLRPILEQVKPVDIRIAETIGQFDTVEMTPEVMSQMAKKGYSQAELLRMKEGGFRYSPSRDSLLSPIVSSDELESEWNSGDLT